MTIFVCNTISWCRKIIVILTSYPQCDGIVADASIVNDVAFGKRIGFWIDSIYIEFIIIDSILIVFLTPTQLSF